MAPLNAFENELEVDWSYTTPVDLGDSAADGLETSRSAREAALAKNSSKLRSVLCVANDKMMNTIPPITLKSRHSFHGMPAVNQQKEYESQSMQTFKIIFK